MARHERLSEMTGIKVYFPDPHSPWQRGTNEKTNGLLRQYFHRRTDLSGFTQIESRQLNTRPRESLGWKFLCLTPLTFLSIIINSLHFELETAPYNFWLNVVRIYRNLESHFVATNGLPSSGLNPNNVARISICELLQFRPTYIGYLLQLRFRILYSRFKCGSG